jgi:hypothetical protein
VALAVVELLAVAFDDDCATRPVAAKHARAMSRRTWERFMTWRV